LDRIAGVAGLARAFGMRVHPGNEPATGHQDHRNHLGRRRQIHLHRIRPDRPRQRAAFVFGRSLGDEQIVARATALLGQHFQVQTVTYQRELFAAPERVSSIPGADLVREDPLKELVRSHVSPQGLDAYVVITKATLKYGTRGVPVNGIGLIRHRTLLDSSAMVHALYVIRVIDGHTFRTIDKKSAGPVDNSSIVRLTGPSRMFDAAELPPIADPLQNESLKAAVSDLINRSLEPTLRDLRLTAP
jgi:hypothetical protein